MTINIVAILFSLFLAPGSLFATITISWNYLPGAEIEESGFEVERAPADVEDWQLIAVNPADIMQIEDIDVPGNRYRVRAFDSVQFYPYSNIGTVPPAPPVPEPPPPCRSRGKSGKCK